MKCSARIAAAAGVNFDGKLSDKICVNLILNLTDSDWRHGCLRAILDSFQREGADEKTIKNTLFAVKSFGRFAYDMGYLDKAVALKVAGLDFTVRCAPTHGARARRARYARTHCQVGSGA